MLGASAKAVVSLVVIEVALALHAVGTRRRTEQAIPGTET